MRLSRAPRASRLRPSACRAPVTATRALFRFLATALVAALRSRPPTSPPDEIFVTALPPYRQFVGPSVSGIAKRALQRAGVAIGRPGAHVFRHTFASQMSAGTCR